MTIMNTVIQGGGTTPTGTKSITANGVYDVTDFASADVQVPTTAPALYREFQLDADGKLLPSASTTRIMNFAGVTDVFSYQMTYAYAWNNAISGAVDLSSLTTISGKNACDHMFFGCTGITSVDLSSLTTISSIEGCSTMFDSCTGITSIDLSSLTTVSGSNGGASMFKGCTSITSVDLSSLITVSGSSGCSSMFEGCTGITSIDLSSLTTISGNSGCNSMFKGCTSITSVDLSSLTTVSTSACGSMFSGCTNITGADLSSLTTISGSGCSSMFSGCTNITGADLSSLTTINGMSCCQNMFSNCTKVTDVSFYALNTDSFGTRTNQFSNMLSGVTGCTVRFPMRIQATIGSWADVINGFGGTNTTVLFDIVCTLTGADTNTYTRSQKNSTSTATAWDNGGTLYYTSGTTEPTVGDTIYSDSACTIAATTVTSIA